MEHIFPASKNVFLSTLKLFYVEIAMDVRKTRPNQLFSELDSSGIFVSCVKKKSENVKTELEPALHKTTQLHFVKIRPVHNRITPCMRYKLANK